MHIEQWTQITRNIFDQTRFTFHGLLDILLEHSPVRLQLHSSLLVQRILRVWFLSYEKLYRITKNLLDMLLLNMQIHYIYLKWWGSPGRDIEVHRLSSWLSTLASSPENVKVLNSYNSFLMTVGFQITSLRMLRQTLPSRSMLGW